MKPSIKPKNPNFSSGPCAKHPGFTLEALNDAQIDMLEKKLYSNWFISINKDCVYGYTIYNKENIPIILNGIKSKYIYINEINL